MQHAIYGSPSHKQFAQTHHHLPLSPTGARREKGHAQSRFARAAEQRGRVQGAYPFVADDAALVAAAAWLAADPRDHAQGRAVRGAAAAAAAAAAVAAS
eukprot:gene28844-48525_t